MRRTSFLLFGILIGVQAFSQGILSPCRELFLATTSSTDIWNYFSAQSQYNFLWDIDKEYIVNNGNPNGWFESQLSIYGNSSSTQYGWDWNLDCPGNPQIQRALYKISVTTSGKGAYFFIDYRGCYDEPGDVYVTYDYSSDEFKQSGNSINGQTISAPNLGQTSCLPLPVIVRNSFGNGIVRCDATDSNSPFSTEWYVASNHSIEAITPQTDSGLVYQFSSWSDAGSISHSVTVNIAHGDTTFTANFTVAKPVQVEDVTIGGSLGQPVTVTWQIHPNANVDYHIYRKVRHNGVTGSEVYLSTCSHATTSFEDPDYAVASQSPDLLFYDVRGHHNPSDTFADPRWLGSTYGEMLMKDMGSKDQRSPSTGAEGGFRVSVTPNPFNPSTTIRYSMESPGYVSLVMFDLLGREIAEIFRGYRPAGSHCSSWDGRNASGSIVAAGMFWLRYTVTDEAGHLKSLQTERLLFVK